MKKLCSNCSKYSECQPIRASSTCGLACEDYTQQLIPTTQMRLINVCDNVDESGCNMSSIYIELIQKAARCCDFYASDLFITHDYVIKEELLKGTVNEVDLYFRRSGISCRRESNIETPPPTHYRHILKLVREDTNRDNRFSISLYETCGNV